MSAAVSAIASSAVSASLDPASGYNRSACTECQRRKQKCNREWPCDRCQRRKIADECRYNYHSSAPPASSANAYVPSAPASGIGHGRLDEQPRTIVTEAEPASASSPSTSGSDAPGFDALAAARLFNNLGIELKLKPSETASKQDLAAEDATPQMQRVLELLPQRQTMDKLINDFTHNINYHYYIIYPPDFLRDYHIWWERRSKSKPIALQYTGLLAMICAICVQHAENAMQAELLRASGLSAEELSEQLHNAVRELSSVIPVGHFHMYNVQRLLHSCYWYKAEARFVEAWHVLSAAIREGQELGLHREPPEGTETEHEREMRRRLWCVLDTWDWQISSGLSRPKIIDRDDCDAELPSLTLERFSSRTPSPLLHMKMQSELTRQLASRFSAPKNIIDPAQVLEYQALIEAWMRRFPAVYDFEHPDLSCDAQYPWVFPHRYYVYTMACLLILNPIRHYMVRSYTPSSPAVELSIHATGVAYSLKLLRTLRSWVDAIVHRDGRLHFIVFSIFDTAAILCTAIIKDGHDMLANRDEIARAIADALAMLRHLNTISRTSRTSYELLERLVRRLPPSSRPKQPQPQRKKAKMAGVAPAASASSGVVMPCAGGGINQLDLAPTPPANHTHQYQRHHGHHQPPAAPSVLRSNHAPIHGFPQTMGAPSLGLPVGPLVPTTSPSCPSSSASDCTSPGVDERMLSSLSLPESGVVVSSADGLPLPPSNSALPTCCFISGDDEAHVIPPTFELETVTQAQLGELAPLWNWHSENLDIVSTMGMASARPDIVAVPTSVAIAPPIPVVGFSSPPRT
ncbi:hypothetical protein CP533_0350 [Ophiocordyceps camponoti-saundersi (nom. inval.)]|nr:hypothetical protein CP533_0350 [Ophiocordyceps camponoti-saundersi (nom. inval.)]